MKPPLPPRPAPRPRHWRLHGTLRSDPFAWLKDPNWREVMDDPERLDAGIRAFLETENAYTQRVMEETGALQESLYLELRGRIQEVDASVPDRDGPFDYYLRYRAGGQHPIICRRPAAGGQEEQVLLDADQRAQGQTYFDLGDFGHSPDHRLFAWTEDVTGSERYSLRILDTGSAGIRPDRLDNCQGGFEWANDNLSIFYTVLDDEHRPRWVYCHRLGTAAGEDRLVYTEADPGFFLALSKTRSGRFILIEANDHVTSEVHLVDADRPGDAPRRVAARTPGIEYSLGDHGDRLLILTNAGGAEDFKLVETGISRPGRKHWRDLVAHRPGTLICDFEIYPQFLVRLERRDALPEIIVRRFDNQREFSIDFDESVFSLGLEGSLEYATSRLRLRYSSMTTPDQIYDFDMRSRERVLRKSRKIPSGHDPGDYRSERIFATGQDGERIPVSVLYHRDTALDGSAPALLYGYGAYGHALPAAFSGNCLSLVKRGFVYAIAHVRGGTECGYRWYREGKLRHKPNTFLDFIAVAETLIDGSWCHPRRLFGEGASAGGLLIGAVANLRPDLFAGLIADVPFVDVLNTMCDDSLPLTPPEWPEWGNPLKDPDAFECIAAYSPYDNVTEQDYPHLLVTAGLCDPRVTYWEPAKWVARLRQLKTDSHLLLLKTNLEAGHGGAPGRFDSLREEALKLAFILKVLGQDVPELPLESP